MIGQLKYMRLLRAVPRISLALAVILLAAPAFAQTWVQTSAPQTNWVSLAASADGTKLVAVSGSSVNGSVYTSTNSGFTWTLQTNAPIVYWGSVASSADGNYLVGAASE